MEFATNDKPVNLLDAVAAARPGPPAPNYLKALNLLGTYTAGTFNIYALAGRYGVVRRVAVMSAIQGFKTPQAKAGINALRATFYDAAGISGGTLHDQERAFVAWAKRYASP
jgi:hypothetical protein